MKINTTCRNISSVLTKHMYRITIYITDYSLLAFPLTFYFICLTYPSRCCALHHHLPIVFFGNYGMHSVNSVYNDDKIFIVFSQNFANTWLYRILLFRPNKQNLCLHAPFIKLNKFASVFLSCKFKFI